MVTNPSKPDPATADPNPSKPDPATADRARELRRELARKIALSVGSEEIGQRTFPAYTGQRTATTAPCSMTYEPSVIVIAQGRKRVELGRNILFAMSRDFC